jgi:hypothetical protein
MDSDPGKLFVTDYSVKGKDSGIRSTFPVRKKRRRRKKIQSNL